jgi:hypothetical protein
MRRYVSVHEFLKLVDIKQRGPVRMLFEVIADNVLNNHFAVVEVSQPDCVS